MRGSDRYGGKSSSPGGPEFRLLSAIRTAIPRYAPLAIQLSRTT